MKQVLHIVENCDDSYGGPSTSIPALIKGHQLDGRPGEIYSLSWSKNDLSSTARKLQINVTLFKCYFKKSLNISFALALKLWQKRGSQTIFHVHNLWNLVPLSVYILAYITKTNYVVSPRGSLFPWSLSQGKIRKKIAWHLYQKSMLNNANFIHVTSESEKKALQDLGINSQIIVVPNGISIENPSQISLTTRKDSMRVLFLSRLHSKKGLEILF